MLGTIQSFQEYDILDLEGAGYEGDGRQLIDWDSDVLLGFGSLIDTLGYINEPNVYVEVDQYDDLGDGTVRTPMLEFSPFDYDYLTTVNFAYPGMKAISDVGDLYEYNPMSGLFSRIRKGVRKIGKKIKGAVKKVGGKIKSGVSKLASGAKKLLSKTPIGKAVVKIGGNLLKTGMKIVKPLSKMVGPIASKIAPVAALVPGAGPLVSAAMTAAGKVGPILKKYGGKLKEIAVVDQKTGRKSKQYKLDATPSQLAKIKSRLEREAQKMRKRPPGQISAMAKSLRKVNQKKRVRKPKRINKKSIAAANRMERLALTDIRDTNRQIIGRIAMRSPRKAREIRQAINVLKASGIQVSF